MADAPVNGSAINGSALAQSAELVLKKDRIANKQDSGNAEAAGDRAELEKIWAGNQADSAIGLKLASIYIEQNEHGKALKILEPLFQRDSSNPQVVRSLVTCYRDSGQTERAVKFFTKQLRSPDLARPAAVAIHDFLGKARQWAGVEVARKRILEFGAPADSVLWCHKDLVLQTPRDPVKIPVTVLWDAGRVIMRNPAMLLQLAPVRSRLARYRRNSMVADTMKLGCQDGPYSIKNTVIHNLETLEFGADDGERTGLLLRPLGSVSV